MSTESKEKQLMKIVESYMNKPPSQKKRVESYMNKPPQKKSCDGGNRFKFYNYQCLEMISFTFSSEPTMEKYLT